MGKIHLLVLVFGTRRSSPETINDECGGTPAWPLMGLKRLPCQLHLALSSWKLEELSPCQRIPAGDVQSVLFFSPWFNLCRPSTAHPPEKPEQIQTETATVLK